MDTQISTPSRVLATERHDAAANDEGLNYIAFWYFAISLLLAAAGASWAMLTI